jgi:hypothetical protein
VSKVEKREDQLNIFIKYARSFGVPEGGQTQLLKLHCKKKLAVFLSPAGMSFTKLYLAGNNLIFPGQGK